MKYRRPAQSFVAIIVACAGLALGWPTGLGAKEQPPQVTKDGLRFHKQTKERLVYERPCAAFTQYKRVSILDCHVEFSKDWVEKYNRDQRVLSRSIRDTNLERAKIALQRDFKKVFTEELQEGGRYQVVDSGGADVLVLRPALINIQVSAPDLMSAGHSVTFVQSASAMTIYLELWDSASNTVLARVIDGSADPGLYELRSRLDLVRGNT